MIVRELMIHFDSQASDVSERSQFPPDAADRLRLWTREIERLTHVTKEADVRPAYTLLVDRLDRDCYN